VGGGEGVDQTGSVGVSEGEGGHAVDYAGRVWKIGGGVAIGRRVDCGELWEEGGGEG